MVFDLITLCEEPLLDKVLASVLGTPSVLKLGFELLGDVRKVCLTRLGLCPSSQRHDTCSAAYSPSAPPFALAASRFKLREILLNLTERHSLLRPGSGARPPVWAFCMMQRVGGRGEIRPLLRFLPTQLLHGIAAGACTVIMALGCPE